MELTSIRQCPFCELRFPNRNVLEAHLREDHPRRVSLDSGVGDGGRASPSPSKGAGHTWS